MTIGAPDDTGEMASYPSRSARIDSTFAVRFWPHGDLWNGIAVDLPIIVVGVTLDDARIQLGHALVSYFALPG